MSLRNVVLEAALWASSRANVKDPIRCLRSVALVPRAFDPARHETVDSVIALRRGALKASGQWARLGQVDVSSGRLLVWERDRTVDEGAAEQTTHGYLDASAMPPWDTWVVYAEQSSSTHAIGPYRASPGQDLSCLVAWVPPPFIASVDRAIGDGLYWLGDSKLPIANVLRADGLLT